MNFVTHRLHEDFECVKSLSQCTAPEQTMATLQEFYSKMANEYQDHFEKQAALLRESLTENAALVEELNETAMESAAELGKSRGRKTPRKPPKEPSPPRSANRQRSPERASGLSSADGPGGTIRLAGPEDC
ncbi:hypothetical protein QW131_21135 [Roseibium salinum]|nr:hypothetical protein [Roseibium salinum]